MPPVLPFKKRLEHYANISLTQSQDLLDAANDAAGVVRNLYLAFLGVAIFICITSGTLTDEKLLHDGAVALPLIEKTDLPYSKFFLVAPWLMVFVHAELLMHLGMLADKLRAFRVSLRTLPEKKQQELRTRLANFTFSHWLIDAENDHSLRLAQGLSVWITIVLFPLITLIAAQLGFLAYQSVTVTGSQRLAALSDICLLGFFWPNLVASGQSRLRWWCGGWSRSAGLRWRHPLAYIRSVDRGGRLRLAMLSWATLWLLFVVATIPGEVWESHLLGAFATLGNPGVTGFSGESSCSSERAFFGFLDRYVTIQYSWTVKKPQLEFDLAAGMHALCPTAVLFHSNLPFLHNFHRTLDLSGRTLVEGKLPEDLLQKMDPGNPDLTQQQVAEIDPLELSHRSFRFANLQEARLFHVNLRDADLQGADLTLARLLGADLTAANLKGAQLSRVWAKNAELALAQLPHVDLSEATLEGVDLLQTNLVGASLKRADLKGARLVATSAVGANLVEADLRGAYFFQGQFEGSDFTEARLDGANVRHTALDDVNLTSASLRGAWFDASLQGAKLIHAQLQGARIAGQAEGADFTDASWGPTQFTSSTGVRTHSDIQRQLARMENTARRSSSQLQIAVTAKMLQHADLTTNMGRLVPKNGICVLDAPAADNNALIQCKTDVSETFLNASASVIADLSCNSTAAEWVARSVVQQYFETASLIPAMEALKTISNGLHEGYLTLLARRLSRNDCMGHNALTPQEQISVEKYITALETR
jgi:uncharacterized protein YjbI with pentapeptide repeats